MIELMLPWPHKYLSPNARKHWRAVAAEKRLAREYGRTLAWQENAVSLRDCDLQLELTFYPKSRRRMDIDNCLSSNKAVIDGVCDGLNIDDRQFKRTVLSWGDVVDGGEIKMTIKLLEDTDG